MQTHVLPPLQPSVFLPMGCDSFHLLIRKIWMPHQCLEIGRINIYLPRMGIGSHFKPGFNAFGQSFHLLYLLHTHKSTQPLAITTNLTGIITSNPRNTFQQRSICRIQIEHCAGRKLLGIFPDKTIRMLLAFLIFTIRTCLFGRDLHIRPQAQEVFMRQTIQAGKVVRRTPTSPFATISHHVANLPRPQTKTQQRCRIGCIGIEKKQFGRTISYSIVRILRSTFCRIISQGLFKLTQFTNFLFGQRGCRMLLLASGNPTEQQGHDNRNDQEKSQTAPIATGKTLPPVDRHTRQLYKKRNTIIYNTANLPSFSQRELSFSPMLVEKLNLWFANIQKHATILPHAAAHHLE